MTSRIFVVMIGTWLMVSGFAWPHTPPERANVVVVGALAVIFALASMKREWPRYANLALAVWLILSTFRFAVASPVSLWHNAIMAAAIFFATMLGGGPADVRSEREIYGRA